MSGQSWRLSDLDESLVQVLGARLGVRPLMARMLVSRGLVELESVGRFLNPRLQDLRPPAGIRDLDLALDRLCHALDGHERLGVFGDYDADGVTSAALLTGALRAFGGAVIPRVASRHAGYGLPVAAIEDFAEAGCRVVVTGDCGTSDVEALTRARALGLDVIVIDHHQVPSGEKLAHALINPFQDGDAFPFKGLASCGIAFYLMAALRSRLGRVQIDMRQFLDLVALGTIADLVPLVDENRILVAAGLKTMATRARPGLRALMELARVQEGPVTEDDVSFRLAPRLNAAGRLGEAQLALDLLLASTDAEATHLAAELDDVNRERQRIQEQVWVAALGELERDPELGAAAGPGRAGAIVLGGEGWHPGVVGIVAARLVDRFHKPAVVIGFEGGQGRGSARTVPGVNLYETLAACREHLVRFGGHAAAAGVTLAPERLADFRRAFNAEVAQVVEAAASRGALPASTVTVDGILDLAELNLALAEELARLGPFGVSNREPVLAVAGVRTTGTRVVGQGHLQLSITSGGAHAEAIAFNMAGQDPGSGAELDVIGMADLDIFRGNRRARLRVKHLLRPRTPPS
jgi:single-stranded-DNA-specific exonuclease